MHLLSTLASGIKGAESGTAEIYARGTSTRVTYYLDFEAGTPVSTGADVSLDSNGGAEIYVNQYVDVVVKDSNGATVREFTEGKAAPNLEYIGQSFTGVDYTTGASATSKPVSAQTIFDAWFTSAGAADFNVLLEGAATTIQAALGTVSGYFFNVKSSAYGAEGDGTTDDTTAITVAVAAAAVNGGIVFFPAGTYRVTSSISLPANVSLLGLGSDISIITMDHASNDLMVLSGASSGGFQFVEGIGFTAAQAYSGNLLYGVTEETYTRFKRCSWGGSYTEERMIDIDINRAMLYFDNCYFAPGEIPVNDFALKLTSDGAAGKKAWYVFDGCHFLMAAGQTADNIALLQLAQGYVTGCRFDCSQMTNALTVICLDFWGLISGDRVVASAVGNFFIGSGTATVYGIDCLSSYMDTYEYGNNCCPDMEALYHTTSFSSQSHANIVRHSREGRYYDYGTDNSAAITLPTRDYANIEITRSDATALVLSGVSSPIGSTLAITINNTAGAPTGNITFNGASFAEDVAPLTVAAGSSSTYFFRYCAETGTGRWWLINIREDI